MSDLISRQAAIDYVDDVPYIKMHPNIGLLWKAWIEQLPSAQSETCAYWDRESNFCALHRPSAQQESEEFEWCHDCKEYDRERHCCHRWTKVIRNTVDELKRPTMLTKEEIKTIRIHINAFKEKLCNQHRYKEAEDYQQIVDKLDVMMGEVTDETY